MYFDQEWYFLFWPSPIHPISPNLYNSVSFFSFFWEPNKPTTRLSDSLLCVFLFVLIFSSLNCIKTFKIPSPSTSCKSSPSESQSTYIHNLRYCFIIPSSMSKPVLIVHTLDISMTSPDLMGSSESTTTFNCISSTHSNDALLTPTICRSIRLLILRSVLHHLCGNY